MTVSIQKILKITILIICFLSNVITLLGSDSVYINFYSILYANLLFLTFFLLAGSRHLFPILYTLIGVFFVLQRIPMIFIDQNNIAVLGDFTIEPLSINSAMLFIVLCNTLAIILSFTLKANKLFCRTQITFSKRASTIIKYYPYIFILFWCIKLVFMFQTGIGFTGHTGDYDLGVFNRLINAFQVPSILLFVGVFIFRKNNKWHIIAIVCLFMGQVLLASKAALMTIALQFIICYIAVVSYRIKMKFLVICCLFTLITFIYAPLAMVFRATIIAANYQLSFGGLVDLFISAFSQLSKFTDLQGLVNMMSSRMASMEWLAAFIQFGREAFAPEMNLYSLFTGIVNTIVPGQILRDESIQPAKYIALIWKGWMTEEHGELAGIFGDLYIYYGYGGGLIGFAFWFWYSSRFILKYNSLFVIIYLWGFALDYMSGGMMVSCVMKTTDFIIVILCLIWMPRILMSTAKLFKHYKKNIEYGLNP